MPGGGWLANDQRNQRSNRCPYRRPQSERQRQCEQQRGSLAEVRGFEICRFFGRRSRSRGKAGIHRISLPGDWFGDRAARPAGWADLAPPRVKRLSETASRSCPPEMLWLERGRRPSRERASSKHPGNKKTFVNQFFNFYRRLAGYTDKSSTKLQKILNDISCLSREVAYSPARRQHDSSRKMIQGNSSYRDYGVSEGANFDGDRLPVGPALFAVFGLSLLGWAVILVPFVAILHH